MRARARNAATQAHDMVARGRSETQWLAHVAGQNYTGSPGIPYFADDGANDDEAGPSLVAMDKDDASPAPSV